MTTDNTPNPYSSPLSNNESGASSANGEQSVQIDFVPILRRWERLRLYYNVTLILFVLILTLIALPNHVSDPGFWAAVVFGGLIANVCFLTGPAVEGYATYFRCWHHVFAPLLFLTGLTLTAFLALASILSFSQL